MILDSERLAALMTGRDRCRSTAVKINCSNNVLCFQNLSNLIHGHAGGKARTTVSEECNNGAVILQTDGIARRQSVVLLSDHNLTVFNQVERSGDGFLDIIRRRAVVADRISSVLENRKIGFLKAAVCLNNITFHNKVTAALSRLHIIIVGVRSHNDRLAGCLFIVSRLSRRRAQIPFQVLRRLCAALGSTALGIVARIGCFELHARARRNSCQVTIDLCIAGVIVQNNMRFRYAFRQRVVCLRDDQLPVRRIDATGLLRRKGCGQERKHHCRRQEQADHPFKSSLLHDQSSM